MLHSILFILALAPLLACAATHPDVFHDGPCPPPPTAAENLQPDQLTGRWFAVRSNYELLKHSLITRQCIEINVTKEDDDYFMATHFKDSTSNITQLFKKFVPAQHQPGSLDALKKMPDGSYSPLGWTYTIVKVQGDSVLEYACKNTEGNQHKVFYRIYSRSIPVLEAEDDELMQIVKDNGDDREMLSYKHENCEYKFN